MEIIGESVSEVANKTIQAILKDGKEVLRTVGSWAMMKKLDRYPIRELHNVTLVVNNPRKRFNTKVSEGMCVEVLDYLLGLNSGFVHMSNWSFYDKWRDVSTGKYPYTYGGRIHGKENSEFIDQWDMCVKKLRADETTRHASIVIWRPIDHLQDFVPCTFSMHFQRSPEGKLDMTVMMRSQDALKGLYLDLFAYTTMHDMMAHAVGASLGKYTHFETNVHIYGKDISEIKFPVSEETGNQGTSVSLNAHSFSDSDKRVVFNLLKLWYVDGKWEQAVKLIEKLPGNYWQSYVSFMLLDSGRLYPGSDAEKKLISNLSGEMYWVYHRRKNIAREEEEKLAAV